MSPGAAAYSELLLGPRASCSGALTGGLLLGVAVALALCGVQQGVGCLWHLSYWPHSGRRPGAAGCGLAGLNVLLTSPSERP